MMKIRITLVAFILSIITQVAFAQEKLTLEACREKAIDYNKILKKSEFGKQEAIANRKLARTAYLPKIDAEASALHVPGMDLSLSLPGGFLSTAETTEAAQQGDFSGTSNVWSPGMGFTINELSLFTAQIGVIQPIYTGGKIRYSNKKADVGVDMLAQNYNMKYSEVIELTDKAYWNLVAINESVVLAKTALEMLTELEEQMQEMYNVGLTPLSEKLKVSVQKNQAKLNYIKAQNGLKIAKMYLNQVIGQDLQIEVGVADTLSSDIELPEIIDGIESALNNRPELKMLEGRVKLSEYDRKIENSEYLPQAGVSVSHSGIFVKELSEDINRVTQIAGQVSIPVFHWKEKKHKRDVATFRVQQAENELSNTIDLITLEVSQVSTQLNESYEAISIAKQNVNESAESLDETKASFEVGLNNTTDVLNAQANWQNARFQLITSLMNFEVLKTTWLRVTGGLVEVN
jgi:outer membrane protein TolC